MKSACQQVLEVIREQHDTTALSADAFEELCRATIFYLRGGFSVQQTARLVAEELFPYRPEFGVDHMTGRIFRVRAD